MTYSEVEQECLALLQANPNGFTISSDDDLGIELRRSKVRGGLCAQNIVVDINAATGEMRVYRLGMIPQKKLPVKQVKEEKKPEVKIDRSSHSFVIPRVADDILDALLDEASIVLWFYGPSGCGKSVTVQYLAERLGMKLFRINCRPSMGSESFFGEKTLVVDEKTGQNKVVWQDGPVVKAMQEGLDEDGNEVGAPGLLYIDEAAAMNTGVAIALNRLAESDDPRRTFVIDGDGGRMVRSHSKFRIILSANTIGRGATNVADALYTAQGDALDISLLNRVGLSFRFGYERKVEEHIAMEKLNCDKTVRVLLRFRDEIRAHIRAGLLSTPFGTRQIVQVCDGYRLYKNMAKAIYYSVFGKLLPEEQTVYNETLVTILGGDGDILAKFEKDAEIDYM